MLRFRFGEWQLRSPTSVRRCYLIELLSRLKKWKCIDGVSLCKRRWTMSCWYVVLWWQSDLTYRNVLRLSQIPPSPSHVLLSSGFSLQMNSAFEISKRTQPHSVFFLCLNNFKILTRWSIVLFLVLSLQKCKSHVLVPSGISLATKPGFITPKNGVRFFSHVLFWLADFRI